MLSKVKIKSFDGVELVADLHDFSRQHTIIFTHGIAEYGSRHDYLVNHLSEEYNILIVDLRGHGESGGNRGYVSSFTDFEKDLSIWLDYIKQIKPEGKVSLFGHSMGALISLGALYSQDINKRISKVFLSAPALGVGDSIGRKVQSIFSVNILRQLGAILGRFGLKGSVDPAMLSHNAKVQRDYIEDRRRLVKLSGRLIFELIARGKELETYKSIPSVEIQILAGSADEIIDIKKIEQYSKRVNKRESLHIIKDALHEMHFEIPHIQKQYFKALKDFF